ncbi:RDD family protein [Sessilibacter sp. MAH2]
MNLIDVQYRVETPEGIDLIAKPAGPMVRAAAFGIDISFRFAICYAVALAFDVFEWSIGVVFITLFIVEWFYPVLFEVLYHGQTPGKKITGIVVVNDDLTAVSWGPSIIRNLLRTADFLPFFYIGGLIFSLSNDSFKRLGDLSAGTVVVYKNRDTKKKLTLPKVAPTAPASALDLEDQIAIIDFTERDSELSQGRKIELANILAPIHGLKDKKAVEHIQSIGRWYLGGKD